MPRNKKIPNPGDRQDLMEQELAGLEDQGEEELELGEPRQPARRRRPAPRPKEGEGAR